MSLWSVSGPTLKNWLQQAQGREENRVYWAVCERENVVRDKKRGSVHSEKIREKCDQCSSFLTDHKTNT